MGDVLPPKRQTVVERLKRRFDLYRRHQNACSPRYEQAANGLYETQRQETLLLKQRYLESKAKKAKSSKNDHRNYRESVTEGTKVQMHSKPLKRPAEEPIINPSVDCPSNEESEKPSKLMRTDVPTDKPSEIQTQSSQQNSLPSFSVQIVQQFNKTSHNQQPQTIQTNVTIQTPALPKTLNSPLPPTPSNPSSKDPLPNDNPVNGNHVECKQEKDCNPSDLCQFKDGQNPGGERLSATFPSLGFTDDSTDDVMLPDILKDLIDDVFTNSADIMKDFNFDDSVGSMKDQEDAAKDIIDLVKESSSADLRAFQTDNLSFVNTPVNQQQSQQHQNGIFRNISSNSELAMNALVTTTTAPSTTASFFTSQRLPSYTNSSLAMPNGLGLDFKLTEPSPAALTLKQMAEQHQNMQHKQQQQQQLTSSSLSSRPSPFSQDNFASHISPLRPNNYLHGSSPSLPSNSPKTPTANNMFNNFDRHMNNMNSYPNTESISNIPISPNIFEADIHRVSGIAEERPKLSNCQQPMQHQKPPVYPSIRPLAQFPENSQVRLQNPACSQQRPVARQFQNGMQMPQAQLHSAQGHSAPQQMHQSSHEIKQPHNLLQHPHSNPYVNFSSQQSINNPAFQVSVSQNVSFQNQFTPTQPISRPPPEYKSQPSNMSVDNIHLIDQLNPSSHMMFNHPTAKSRNTRQQKTTNVAITSDATPTNTSVDWRHNMMQGQSNQFRMNAYPNNYGNFVRNDQQQQQQMFNQYRLPSQNQPVNRLVRSNMMQNHMMMQQRQRLAQPQQRQRITLGVEQQAQMTANNNVLTGMAQSFSSHQDMNRNDNNPLNLDFLDNIESSASDLLNFDQVIQSGTHFPLLDDMEILGK